VDRGGEVEMYKDTGKIRVLRQEKAIISTTHIDLHHEKLTKEALDGMAEQINSGALPVNWEHNPLLPPIGRVVSASVEPTKDKEYALVATIEIFDLSSFPTISEIGLTMPSEIPELSSENVPTSVDLDIELQYDPQNYPEATIKKFCSDIVGIKIRDKQISRKALEPISVIWLTLLAPAAYFFSKGFFTRLGEHSADEFINYYKDFKSRIIDLIKPRHKKRPTSLIIKFRYQGTDIEGAIQGEDSIALESALDGFSELLSISKKFIELNPDVKIKSIQSLFDPHEHKWVFNYLVTNSGEMIIGEHLAKDFRGKNV
jgi:hypothetical protein